MCNVQRKLQVEVDVCKLLQTLDRNKLNDRFYATSAHLLQNIAATHAWAELMLMSARGLDRRTAAVTAPELMQQHIVKAYNSSQGGSAYNTNTCCWYSTLVTATAIAASAPSSSCGRSTQAAGSSPAAGTAPMGRSAARRLH